MSVKPILFNTEMVRAILENRKMVTRRVVKPQPVKVIQGADNPIHAVLVNAPDEMPRGIRYRSGDILYVRETWQYGFGETYLYKADAGYDLFMTAEGNLVSNIPWRPSIHMPREAARIFLRVTDVRVERLQSISYDDCLREGITEEKINERDVFRPASSAKRLFARLWNRTLKPADRGLYGWDANPWVWVIEFERISKEEAQADPDQLAAKKG